ncbi:electron transport complex subunit RsxB [Azohydromonas sp. G-1-1-14]|uniref:Electron transport complex subunit RsxB n=1 Tax=Azohydromonas caseinilytica TaxID=2728836 RepID=A0A848F8H0_9BURK|nr:electron transport complex subunit RsxB [Azohydromonas caseinilytica]
MQGLAAAIDAALPQTQCTRCGYADCRAYAQAVAEGTAAIDRCPPGGAEGVRRLAELTGQAPRPLDAACGSEGPRQVAFIDEAWCIGCTLCIKACPVDCIAGATKRMHTVIESECTGCALCLLACPVDCIVMEPVTTATGWAAWSPAQAEHARRRYAAHRARLAQAEEDTRERLIARAELKLADLPAHSQHQDPATLDKKRAVIEAALARARAQRASRV